MIVWSCCGYVHKPHPSNIEYWLTRRYNANTRLIPLCSTAEAAKAAYQEPRGYIDTFFPFQVKLERVP